MMSKKNKFTRIGNEIQSLSGYKIRFGLEHLSYIQDDKHSLAFDAYFISELGNVCRIYINDTYWKWYPPNDNELITDEKKAEIVEKIESALNAVGIKFELI